MQTLPYACFTSFFSLIFTFSSFAFLPYFSFSSFLLKLFFFPCIHSFFFSFLTLFLPLPWLYQLTFAYYFPILLMCLAVCKTLWRLLRSYYLHRCSFFFSWTVILPIFYFSECLQGTVKAFAIHHDLAVIFKVCLVL